MRTIGFLLLAGTAALPAVAQTPGQQTSGQTPPAATPAPAEHESEEEGGEVVVQGQRPPGSVVGDVKPEQTLSPADIRSYGVSSVADLLAQLAPQTRSGRGSGGAPVVLVDGRRVSGFQEIRNLPTEAILRVEILPEEVALKYGYRADQRVVNFVLRRRFRAVAVELNHTLATEGGRNQPEAETDLVHIRNGKRLNLHLEYTQADSLTEAERSVIQSPSNYALGGNVVGGAALSPTLGSVVAVPGVAATRAPTLADFTNTTNAAADQSPYRTLLPQTKNLAFNGTYATSVFGNVAASINATAEHQVTDSERGLPTVSLALPVGNPYSPFAVPVTVQRAFDGYGPLAQHGTSTDLHLGGTLNGMQGRWRWTVTLAADHSQSDTATQTGLDATALQARLTALDPAANPYGALGLGRLPDNIGRSNSTSVALDTTANGPLFALPAGDASATVKIGSSTSDFSSSSIRNGIASGADIGRDIANAQLNVDLPIARRDVALSGLGNLSLNGNVAIDRLSDFGSLWTFGYGATWSPIKQAQVIVSVTDQDEAPSAAQLGNPTVLTPGVRVFDYVRGTTATVTTVSGGNNALGADSRHVFKAGLNLTPFSGRDINFTANYITQRTDDPIASFPAASAAIEAAFPGRFTRDAAGNLLRIDQRPINFARTETSQLRYGFNVSFAIKSTIQKQIEAFRAGTGPNPFEGLRPPGGFQRPANRPDGSAAPDRPGGTSMAPGNAPAGGGSGPGGGASGGSGGGFRGGFGVPGGPGGGRFGGGGFGGGAGQAGGRVQFALYHTWNFTNRVTVADGGPVLDLLNGDATGNSGGAPRHQLEGQAGYSNNGLGARLSVNYQSGTHVNGGTAASPTTLDFGGLTTANLRLWADPGQRLDLLKKAPWLRGARVSLSIDNLFNQRQRVTDQTGAVPIGFQPAYMDALGRTVRLSVRKLFF